MDELLRRIDGHLQDVSASQRHSVREIDGVKGTVADLHTHLSNMQASVTKLQGEMVKVQIDLRRLDAGFDGLRVNMLNADTAIGELRGTFASLGVMMKDHARRLRDLEDKQAS